jgi:ribose 5-phosphate isomerase RpiB
MPDKRNISIEEIADMVRQVLDKEFSAAESEPVPRPEATRPRNRQIPKAFLVTQEMVEDCNRLGTDLQLPYHHILTPSAKDAINQLGVKVNIDSDSSVPPNENLKEKFTRVCFWSDRYSREIASNLADSLPGDVKVDEISSDDNLSEIVRHLRGDNAAAAIAISETGAELSVLLNKYAGVRAIFAESVDAVKAARERAAVNCLVISAQQTSLLKGRQLIDSFLGTSFKNPASRKMIEDMLRAERDNLTNEN